MDPGSLEKEHADKRQKEEEGKAMMGKHGDMREVWRSSGRWVIARCI